MSRGGGGGAGEEDAFVNIYCSPTTAFILNVLILWIELIYCKSGEVIIAI